MPPPRPDREEGRHQGVDNVTPKSAMHLIS
jgi:hypothetical protein